MSEIFKDLKKIQPWFLSYLLHVSKSFLARPSITPTHVFLCICDHFEPLWRGASTEEGFNRVKLWVDNYPKIADKYRDSGGCIPKYTFFYPEEEYREEYLELLADLTRRGYGEVEVHLHHDNDNSDNLRKTLNNFKNKLVNKHGLLAKDKNTGEVKYGFIHGNWALDNSRPDGRLCGVNDEISILQETGCYADFTMPSAPDVTQTAKINSIYYAVDNPLKPKSHNTGILAEKGKSHKGLLMIQGPLMLDWNRRKWKVFPKIENGSFSYDCNISPNRMKLWLNADIRIRRAPQYVFIKLHTHGCQEKNIKYLLGEGLDDLFSQLQEFCNKENIKFHYVSAREMVNIIKAGEDDMPSDINTLRDYKFISTRIRI